MVLVAVVCAETEEVQDIAAQMESPVTQTLLGRDFTRGCLHGVDTVVVRSHVGKVACAATTAVLITQYKPDVVLFIGVAGGLSTGLNIGDVVVSSAAVQHDMDARPFSERCVVPETGDEPYFRSARPELGDAVAQSLREALSEPDSCADSGLSRAVLSEFGIKIPTIHRGVIATGDQFICNAEGRAHVLECVPDSLCVEMEGASLAQVCAESGVPFVIVRAISDNGGDVSVDFAAFMEKVTTPYCAILCRAALPVLAKMLG